MLFGFPQYPFPAKKQPILRTAHTKSAVFSVKVSGFPVHARESRRYFHCPIFSKRFIDKLRRPDVRDASMYGTPFVVLPQRALRSGLYSVPKVSTVTRSITGYSSGRSA